MNKKVGNYSILMIACSCDPISSAKYSYNLSGGDTIFGSPQNFGIRENLNKRDCINFLLYPRED